MNFQEKSCYFCKNNVQYVDYKESEFLRNFINFQGKIYPRKKTGVCTKHQRSLAQAVKRARTMALLSATSR